MVTKKNTKHGYSTRGNRSREYITWRRMKARCHAPSGKANMKYGGRGITVCARWRASFTTFLEDMGKCPPNKSIDRIDNEGDYEPGNCRWASAKQQANNRRNTHFLAHKGVTLNLADWAQKVGIRSSILYKRMRRGWNTEDILFTPYGERRATA